MSKNKTKADIYSLSDSNRSGSPLVFEFPHSGRCYPSSFKYDCDFNSLRRSEDLLVDRLYEDFLIRQDYPFIKALFPRSYIDVNRKPDAENAHRAGLLREKCAHTVPVPIYKAPVPLKEIFNRISGYYRPYHQALEKLLNRTAKKSGGYVFVSCHSMPSMFGKNHKNPFDIALGTNHGKRCAPELLKVLRGLFEQKGYTVGENIKGFEGGHNIQKYGAPHHNKHAIMIEINRGLYADEEKFVFHGGAAQIQQDLTDIMAAFDRIARVHVMPPSHPKRHLKL